jgi:hypothetical protein
MAEWLPQEDAVLREMWAYMDSKTLMYQMPGRSQQSIGSRASVLGLRKNGSRVDWSVALDFYINKEAPNGCWEWLGSMNSTGYGVVSTPVSHGGKWKAHRYVWRRHHGRIPRSLDLLHKCHNKRCVNPDHLYLGTDSDNQLDEVRKGRWDLVLTKEKVIRARELAASGVPYTEIVKMVGGTKDSVSAAIRRVNWQWVLEPL